ncbi:MAG: hypothetical protein U0457_16290 [Candidatus Sericytochromatia bacterium]
MQGVSFISGEIDLSLLSKEKRLEVKRVLESFFGSKYTDEVYREDYLSFEEEWENHEDTDAFMQLLIRVATLLDKKTVSRLMCEGETHKDYWGIIIKNNKLYIQKYVLKPASDKREFVVKV